jgi:hypothetical protein
MACSIAGQRENDDNDYAAGQAWLTMHLVDPNRPSQISQFRSAPPTAHFEFCILHSADAA